MKEVYQSLYDNHYDSQTSILKSCKVAELPLKFDNENDDKNYEISIYETSTERRRHNHYI